MLQQAVAEPIQSHAHAPASTVLAAQGTMPIAYQLMLKDQALEEFILLAAILTGGCQL